MSGWKRVVLVSASIGAGIVVSGALIIGGLFWYENRPNPPRLWDAKVLTASYYAVDTGEPPQDAPWGKRALAFYYDVTNNSDYDYRLGGPESVTVMGRLEDTKSLVGDPDEKEIRVEHPVFIPARQSVRIRIWMPSLGFDEVEPDDAEARKAFKKRIVEHLREKLSNLDGFVVFDSSNRYQINFPSGWKAEKGEKPSLKK